jgi:hypothetical protein
MEERDREVSYVQEQAEQITQDRNRLNRQNCVMKGQIASLKKEVASLTTENVLLKEKPEAEVVEALK